MTVYRTNKEKKKEKKSERKQEPLFIIHWSQRGVSLKIYLGNLP